jgi:hypothetical protein
VKRAGVRDRAQIRLHRSGRTPRSLMNDVIDAYALSPPSAEITEASGKGYVLIPLGKGEIRN